MPPQKEIVIDGVKVLLVHGSPRRNNEDILPNMPLKDIEDMLINTNADLIFADILMFLQATRQIANKQL